MGNEMCPVKTKDIITELAEIEKGEITYQTYQTIFRGCLNGKNIDREEIDFIRFRSHSAKDIELLNKLESKSSIDHAREYEIIENKRVMRDEEMGEVEEERGVVEMELGNGWRYRLFVMTPHTQHFHNLFCFQQLIDEAVLDVNPPGIGTRQVTNQLFIGWRVLIGVIVENCYIMVPKN